MGAYQYSLPHGYVLKSKSYHYTIERVLGQGTFGITYLASVKMSGALGAIDANIKVAVKEFFMRELNDRSDASVISGSKGSIYYDYRKKFIRESLNLSKLHHPGIIKVIESFEANNTVYYVMEYIDGGSLDDFILRNNRLGQDETIRLTKQIGTALSFMHAQGMLHLDLKPSNIMMKETGDVVLIDFGLSKQYDANGIPESSTTVGGGTPGYAPIEQAYYHEGKGFPVTMDIYALGGTMYKMLTGCRPPEASEILNNGFPLEELQTQQVTASLSACIEKAMEPKKSDRYQSVEELISKLSEIESQVHFDNENTITLREGKIKKYKYNPDVQKTFYDIIHETSKVIFNYSPFGICLDYYEVSVTPSYVDILTHESYRSPIKLPFNKHSFENFLNKLQGCVLELKLRSEEVPYEMEDSEEAAKFFIRFLDKQDNLLIELWIAGYKSQFGNIIGYTEKIRERFERIIPFNEKLFELLHRGRCTSLETPPLNEKLFELLHREGTITEKTIIDVSDEDKNTGIKLGSELDHNWVDLGLSVKWASCNVGATKPEEYGDYYAWGEIETKRIYSISTYKFLGDRGILGKILQKCNKYNNVDSLWQLELQDDVARQKWGGNWRMPTEKEFRELMDNCSREWTTMNGVNGYKVTSKKFGYTSRSIFLPAAGWCGTSPIDRSSGGYYWSSSLFAGYLRHAQGLGFYSGSYTTTDNARYYGLSVRPVCQ